MANLTNSAKLIAEMEKKANLTDLPDVYDSTVTVVVNGNTGSNTFSTNQSSNSTLKVTVGKSDVGLGNVDNTSDANKPISTATQAALDLKADKSDISSVYKYKGSVANYESLPSSGQTVGDVYNVEAAHTTAPIFPAGSNLAWDGSAWDVLGGTVDLSNYVDKSTNQTIGGTKTFSTSPVVPSKTSDAANTGTAIATEAQVYKKANKSDVLTKTNTTSYTPSANYHPATKKYVDDRDTYIGSSEPTSNKIEGRLWYDTTNDQLKVYDGTNWNAVENEYNAGKGINFGTVQDYSAMRGPCPEGFHVPLKSELENVLNIIGNTFQITKSNQNVSTYLKLPAASGRLSTTGGLANGDYCNYFSSEQVSGNNNCAHTLHFDPSSGVSISFPAKSVGGFIRPFKDISIIPNSNWTIIYDGSSVATGAGIYHNSTLGLISISGDGENWITITDKNLGASTVYNYGDNKTNSNCGGPFQRGNNYMFPYSGDLTISSTQVDASNYGPGNYYNSNIFITTNNVDWSSVRNGNLWGGTTGVVTLNNVITNTGVLSVNGQTGAVTVNEGDVKVFEVPAVNDDISDIINGLDSGKCVILTEFTGGGHEDIYIVSGINYNQGWLFATRYIGKVGVAAGAPSASTVKKITYNNSTHVVTAINTEESTFADESDVLTKTNTTSYTPTANYHPATKKYVDDHAGGGHDYSWETATISSGTVTLGLRTVVEPTSNFTLNAPLNLEDGMEYVLRCVNGSTAYTLTLGTGFVNDFSTDLTLHANHSDQFTFVAYDGTLELQPDYATKDYVDDMIGNIETLLSNI